MKDVRITRGDSKTYILTLNGGLLNQDGGTAYLFVKKKLTDTKFVISKVVACTGNSTAIVLLSTDTDIDEGTYYLSVRYVNGSLTSTAKSLLIIEYV